MADKDWLGADLIFDLDGDHLPGVTDKDFPAMIEVIQEQAWSLWNDFLEPDFGFNEEYLQVTFSGHRGFHLHYRDPKFFHLDSEARRELVSHIRGEGVEVSDLLELRDYSHQLLNIQFLNFSSTIKANVTDLTNDSDFNYKRPFITIERIGTSGNADNDGTYEIFKLKGLYESSRAVTTVDGLPPASSQLTSVETLGGQIRKIQEKSCILVYQMLINSNFY